MVIAYKGFDNNLSCRGYSFDIHEWNEEGSATCQESGLHAALNPLDCLSYYVWNGTNRFFEVLCDGEVHHQGTSDTKVSSTRMKLVRELRLEDFLLAAMKYIYANPYEPLSSRIAIDKGIGKEGERFVLCYGETPIAKGKKGQIVGLIEAHDNVITGMNLFKIDGKDFLPNQFYDIDGSKTS